LYEGKNIFRRTVMNKKLFLMGMLACVLAFGLSLSGCATNKATTKGTNFEKKPVGLIGTPKYSVLGTVTLEKDWFGIVGFSTPTMGPISAGDHYIYQSGGVTYVEMLEEAKKLYPEADAVIDINIDYTGSQYWIFYGRRRNIVAGLAIKYSRDEVGYPPKNEKEDTQ
jgi:hypothetical protein